MKRIISVLIAAAVALQLVPAAFAEEAAVYDVKYKMAGGGQYIYCNNPEFVKESDLTSYDNPDARYIMNNENLQPGEYTLFLCYYNWTAFNIEPDVEFKSDDKAVITINSAGYYVPQSSEYWDCLGAWSDLLGVDIRPTNGTEQYVHYTGKTKLPARITLDGGNDWASKYIYNYEVLPPQVTFNMLINFTIESGSADVNCVALKSSGILRDRSMHNPDAKPGRYVQDTTIKGICTDSLPIVEADFDINITDDTQLGKNLAVRVFNSYYPNGNIVPYWMTNINPAHDGSAAVMSAGACSDMLGFTYKDDEKLEMYGVGVPESERDNIWKMDLYHYDTKEYRQDYAWSAEDYRPNDELPEYDAQKPLYSELQFNLGNFGVTNRHNITITNTAAEPRSLNYFIESSCSSNIVIVRDEEGNILNPYTLTRENPYALNKHITWGEQKEECLFSAEVMPGETKKYTLDVILPTNTYGGQKNILRVDDHKNLAEKPTTPIPEYNEINELARVFYTGGEYMKWADGNLFRWISETQEWKQIELPGATRDLFREEDYEITLVKTDKGYAAKYSVWDRYSDWKIEYKSAKNKVYFLDENMEYQHYCTFPDYVYNMVYSDHTLYVQSDAFYQSEDNTYRRFIPIEDATVLPVRNGEFTLVRKIWPLYRRTSGGSGRKINFERETPPLMYAADGLFYYKKSYQEYTTDVDTENILSVSRDGINWTDLRLPSGLLELLKVYRMNGKIYVATKYETFEYDDIPKAAATVMLNGEYLSFEASPEITNGRTMVPLRFLAEKLGAQVIWFSGVNIILIKRAGHTVRLSPGDKTAYCDSQAYALDCAPYIKDGRTMVPLRFIADCLDCKVKWDEKTSTAVITG